MPDDLLFALGAGVRMLAGALLLALTIRCWRAENGHLYPWRWLTSASVTMAAWNGLGDLEAATNFLPQHNLRLLTIQWIWVPWLLVAIATAHILDLPRR